MIIRRAKMSRRETYGCVYKLVFFLNKLNKREIGGYCIDSLQNCCACKLNRRMCFYKVQPINSQCCIYQLPNFTDRLNLFFTEFLLSPLISISLRQLLVVSLRTLILILLIPITLILILLIPITLILILLIPIMM